MTKQLLSYLRIRMLLMFCATSTFAWCQDGVAVRQLASFDEFKSISDTLNTFSGLQGHLKYDYIIQYSEIRAYRVKSEKHGTLVVRNDSIVRAYSSKPTIAGDLFSANPELIDKVSEYSEARRLNKKEKKWINDIRKLNGFWLQSTRIGKTVYYPRYSVTFVLVQSNEGFSFGLVKYGIDELDTNLIGGTAHNTLKELVELLFW